MTFEWNPGCSAQHCNDFAHGLQQLKESAISQALLNLQRAYDNAPYDDIFHNKYASYYGLARVLNGDKTGIELCRDAVSHELLDGDIFLNLAYVECHMKNRQRAISVLEQGLQIDQQHPGLIRLQGHLGMRSENAITFIARNSFINKTLGLFARKNKDSKAECAVEKLML